MGLRQPEETDLADTVQYRIVPSRFPPIDPFERLVPADQRGLLLELEAMTNERLREQIGAISRVPPEDRVFGPGASAVMAPFTHIGRASRFSAGGYGLYYAALDLDTAVAETAYHRARFLGSTREAPGEVDMRTYQGEMRRPLLDIRDRYYQGLYHPDDYSRPQTWGRRQRDKGAWGVYYQSVRRTGGECVGAFRPPAVSIPRQTLHFAYVWDGERIIEVYRKSSLRRL